MFKITVHFMTTAVPGSPDSLPEFENANITHFRKAVVFIYNVYII